MEALARVSWLSAPLHLLWEAAFPQRELSRHGSLDSPEWLSPTDQVTCVPLYHFFYGHQLTPKDCVEPWFLTLGQYAALMGQMNSRFPFLYSPPPYLEVKQAKKYYGP